MIAKMMGLGKGDPFEIWPLLMFMSIFWGVSHRLAQSRPFEIMSGEV